MWQLYRGYVAVTGYMWLLHLWYKSYERLDIDL